jgi:hypothetical protein
MQEYQEGPNYRHFYIALCLRCQHNKKPHRPGREYGGVGGLLSNQLYRIVYTL